MRKTTTKDFIRTSEVVHNYKYDYSNTVYINRRTKLKVGCNLHGEFTVYPHDHRTGTACGKCALENRAKRQPDTTEDFIRKANSVHGKRYDYSLVKYTGDKVPVKIICAIHGEFEIRPTSHLRGFSGCSGCEKCGFKKDRPATLYVLSAKNTMKVGITNRKN